MPPMMPQIPGMPQGAPPMPNNLPQQAGEGMSVPRRLALQAIMQKTGMNPEMRNPMSGGTDEGSFFLDGNMISDDMKEGDEVCVYCIVGKKGTKVEMTPIEVEKKGNEDYEGAEAGQEHETEENVHEPRMANQPGRDNAQIETGVK